jgi:hypothetical protein
MIFSSIRREVPVASSSLKKPSSYLHFVLFAFASMMKSVMLIFTIILYQGYPCFGSQPVFVITIIIWRRYLQVTLRTRDGRSTRSKQSQQSRRSR